MTDRLTVTPRVASKALRVLIHARQPVCLWSQPGCAKSSLTHQAAAAEQMQISDQRLVTLDPTDLRGMPTISLDRTTTLWTRPEFLPTTGRGILFLDELNRAPQLVQNAALQLVLDRRIGSYRLPDEWTIAAACNYHSDGGVQKMSSALASRFSHLHLKVDVDDWSKWALGAQLEPVTRAFIRFRPDLLHAYDKNAEAYPCPRTWEFVSGISAQQPDPEVELPLIAGTVGQGAALEYCAFSKMFRALTATSIDSILMNPSTAPVPAKTDAATAYAISAGLARKATDTNVGRVITYLERLPLEYNAFAVQSMTARDEALTNTNAFIDWTCKHSDVVL